MTKYRLSDRAKVLLVLISERTRVENGDFSNPQSFFVPPRGNKISYLHSVRLREDLCRSNDDISVFVDGASDACVFRSLERKRLTRRMTVANYSYAITEDGRVEAERILSADEIGKRTP